MVDGMLVLSGFRSDVSPYRLEVFDAVARQLVLDSGASNCWAWEVDDRTVYYLEVPEDWYMNTFDMSLKLAAMGRNETVAVFSGLESGTMGGISCGMVTLFNSYHDIHTGEAVTPPSMITNQDYAYYGVDSDGRFFAVKDYILHRQGSDGEMYAVADLNYLVAEGYFAYVTAVVGDYAYLTVTSDYSSSTIYPVYAAY